jgi:hypothetical protein
MSCIWTVRFSLLVIFGGSDGGLLHEASSPHPLPIGSVREGALDGGLLHEASSPHPLPIGSVQAAGLKAPAASTRLLRRPREPSSSHC